MANECPFSLPLARGQFADALRRGHGRAVMHVTRHGATGLDDLVVQACVHNKTFDPQCEEDRASWMMEIAESAGLAATVCGQVLDALDSDTVTRSFWDTKQRCRLALAFAKRGHAGARRALYAALRKCDDSADLIAAEEIIELDGTDGLLFVAERIGEWLTADPDIAVGDFPLCFYAEHHAKGSAERILESAAKENDRVAMYLGHVRAQSDEAGDPRAKGRKGLYREPGIMRFRVSGQSRSDRFKAMTAQDVIRDIESGAPGMGKYAYSGWGTRASEEALRTVVDRLFRESDSDRLARFLGAFQNRPPPEFDVRLLEFARHSERDVRWVAVFVLAHFGRPEVRALALDRLRKGRHNERELMLFRRNYAPGDWPLIRGALRWPADESELHWLLSDLLDVFEANPVDESSEPLVLVYERTPCTNCRRRTVQLLLDRGQAPEWLVDECRFDSSELIRRSVS